MRWFFLAAVLGLSSFYETSFSQRPPDDERLTTDSESLRNFELPDAGFFDAFGYAKFHLIQGRLTLDSVKYRKGSQKKESGSVAECINVSACRGTPSVHYRLTTPRRELVLNAQSPERVQIESLLKSSGQRASLTIVPGKQVLMTIGPDNNERKYAGATLLHVRLDDPESFDAHWNCLLKRLLRGQSLKQLNKQVAEILLTEQSDSYGVSVAEIHQQIEKLRSSKISARRTAEQTLVRFGSCVLPVIATLNQRDLDAEQRNRLKKIRNKLLPFQDDTARSLAAMLINDRDHWQRMAKYFDSGQRQIANGCLHRIGLQALPSTDKVIRFAGH